MTGNIPALPHPRVVTLILLFLTPEEMSLGFTLQEVHHFHTGILNTQTTPNGGEPQILAVVSEHVQTPRPRLLPLGPLRHCVCTCLYSFVCLGEGHESGSILPVSD